MWPDRVSNPGPLSYKSGVLPTALCGPARSLVSVRGARGGCSRVTVNGKGY